MSNRNWRIALGAVAALCSFLLVQPAVQDIVPLMIAIGGINVVAAFLKAPEDGPA